MNVTLQSKHLKCYIDRLGVLLFLLQVEMSRLSRLSIFFFFPHFFILTVGPSFFNISFCTTFAHVSPFWVPCPSWPLLFFCSEQQSSRHLSALAFAQHLYFSFCTVRCFGVARRCWRLRRRMQLRSCRLAIQSIKAGFATT